MDTVKAQENLLQKQRLQDLLAKSPVSEKLIGNLCRYFCPRCQREMRSLVSLTNHLRIKHGEYMTARNVILLEGNVIVAHECQLCHARVVCDTRVLGQHLWGRHKIRIQKYCHYHGKRLERNSIDFGTSERFALSTVFDLVRENPAERMIFS